MRFILLTISILFFVTSCSPSKRLQRLQKKHPELFQEMEQELLYKDTIIDTISISIEETADSAVFIKSIIKDSINIEFQNKEEFIVETDDFKTTVIIKPNELGEEEVKIKTVIKERIITKEIPIYIEKKIKVKVDCPKPKRNWWIILLSISFSLCVGIWFYEKYVN